MNPTSRKLIALVGIAVFAFAQLALAAYACPNHTMASAAMPMPAVSGPCDEGQAPSPSVLCERHCQDEQQKPNDSASQPAVFHFVAAFWTLVEDRASTIGAELASQTLLQVEPPPLSVRNCCFRL